MAFADRFRRASTAQAEFANRSGEQSSFDRSLANYVESINELAAGAWHATDPDRPRRNVLVYYGIGGIGKSRLLGKLVDRLGLADEQPTHWPPPVGYTTKYAHCRLDASDFDPEDTLLILRASLMALQQRILAFDMCLGRYWAERHANDGIIDAFQHRGRLSKIGDTIGVGEHIQLGIEEVCSSVLGTALPGISAFRAISNVGTAVWRNHLDATALRGCPHLDELLAESPTNEVLPLYAYALAWDLEQIQRREQCRVIVTIDTFEEASRPAVEFFNRLIWMLPNVLFVIAGRNSLEWASPVPELEFSGARRWPGLVLGAELEPRQHLVGYLSMTDRLRWLDGVFAATRVSADVLSVAAEESQGLPVHLDLIAQHLLDTDAQRDVTTGDATGNLDVVARRVLRDLSDAQGRALLAACLYRRFDEELVRVTADLPNGGPVLELITRPYVESLNRGSYGFRLHDLLCKVFRGATGLGDNQWLREDWRRAALRGADLLHRRLDESQNPVQAMEHAELLFALVATFGLELDWLPGIAERLTAVSNWNSEWAGTPLSSLAGDKTWATALADGLNTIMTRQLYNRTDIAAKLERDLFDHGTDRRLDVLRYFMAQARRDSGDEESSLLIMTSLLSGSMKAQAVKDIIDVHRRRGNFLEARRIHVLYQDVLQNSDRVLAEILWTEGRLDGAAQAFLLAAERARTTSDGGELALCLASAAWCHALIGNKERAGALVAEARTALRSNYQSFADLMAGLAEGLVQSVAGKPANLGQVERLGERYGHTSIVAYARFAACLADAITDRGSAEVPANLERLARSVDNGAFAHLLAIASHIHGRDWDGIEWREEDILATWKKLATSRTRELANG